MISKNKYVVSNFVIKDLCGQLDSFEVIEARVHKNSCNCDHYRFKIEVKNPNSSIMKSLANNSLVKEVDLENNVEFSTITFVSSYNSLKHKFHDYFTEVFPSIKEYASFENNIKETIYCLLYKTYEDDELHYKFLSDDVHSYCEEHKDSIQSSILIENKSMLWMIIGTGCGCSDFEPLLVEDCDKVMIYNLVLYESIKYKKHITHDDDRITPAS